MASANFNTQIVSSDSNGRIRSYSLDKVINKDFEGPYEYNFNTDFFIVPDGISLVDSELLISPNVKFELSIVVTQSGFDEPIEAIATTTVTIEETPLANFNTEIVSPSSKEQAIYDADKEQFVVDGKFNEYVLDEVIEKNFEGPYNYQFLGSDVANVDFAENGVVGIDFTDNGVVGIDFPRGLEIIENMEGQQVLLVGPNIEFELSIFVGSRNEMNERGAIATTMITIEGKPNFSKEITKFFENPNYKQNKEQLVGNWSSIISERISGGDKIDGPIRVN
jgi:hypothetical protein